MYILPSCLPSSGAMAFSQAQFGEGRGPIFLNYVTCIGTESKLLSCEHDGIGGASCDHSEDAGVICQGDNLSN